MAKNLMICSNVANALHLNESESVKKRYILEGTFAELDKMNRNQRIYTKAEYLKHLAYLRNDIKSGETLYGELDHPEDRFEVKLKEASHRVIDLWYDESDNTIKGKIELLDTPNGDLAKSLVEQGIPLHISSRAAGTVNSDNTVSIQQIYTYDLVCKPGFAGAVLHRVNESANAPQYTDEIKDFLNSSLKSESMNSAVQYGFLNEDVSVSEISANTVLRKEAKDLQINNQIEIDINTMTTPLCENNNPDATVGKPLNISGNGAAALGIPTALETEENKEEKKEDVSDTPAEANDKPAEDKKCPKCGNEPCTCEKDKKDDTSEADDTSERDADKDNKDTAEKLNDDKDEPDPKSDDDNSDNKDEDKDKDTDKADDSSDDSDSGVKIIEVEAEFEGDNKDDMIKDVEPDFSDDDDKDDKADDKPAEKEEGEPESDTEDSKDEAEKTVEVGDDKDRDPEEEEKKAKEADELADKASKDISDRKDKIMDKLDKLREVIEKKNNDKKESKNESIIMAQYPISMKMNESNFADFAKLDELQKNKVVAYLHDNGISDSQAINENWNKGIDYVNEIPVWLAKAPTKYKELYESASDQVKESINCTASYVLFESQYDVDLFWENSGLAEANERKLLNESFINNAPKVTVETKETNLPYNTDFIKQITEMACEYNKKY